MQHRFLRLPYSKHKLAENLTSKKRATACFKKRVTVCFTNDPLFLSNNPLMHNKYFSTNGHGGPGGSEGRLPSNRSGHRLSKRMAGVNKGGFCTPS